jgi:hypothetical protein
MGFRRRLSSFFRRGAAAIEPEEADARFVMPPDLPRPPHAHRQVEHPETPEGDEHISPDAKELEREHRGY